MHSNLTSLTLLLSTSIIAFTMSEDFPMQVLISKEPNAF